eukprot:gene32449-31063_t
MNTYRCNDLAADLAKLTVSAFILIMMNVAITKVLFAVLLVCSLLPAFQSAPFFIEIKNGKYDPKSDKAAAGGWGRSQSQKKMKNFQDDKADAADICTQVMIDEYGWNGVMNNQLTEGITLTCTTPDGKVKSRCDWKRRGKSWDDICSGTSSIVISVTRRARKMMSAANARKSKMM